MFKTYEDAYEHLLTAKAFIEARINVLNEKVLLDERDRSEVKRAGEVIDKLGSVLSEIRYWFGGDGRL